MFNRFSCTGFSLREQRTINLLKEVWPNAKTWGSDVSSTYVEQGIKEKDPIKIAAGIPMAAASIFFEAPDYIYAGIADQKLETPTGTRTWRDIKEIGNNHVRHPIRTLLSGLRLFSDVPMDIADKVISFKHNRATAIQTATRADIHKTLAPA